MTTASTTRADHLDWCKARALEYLDAHDTQNAVMSMMSDLGKHDETAGHIGGELGAMMLLSGFLDRPDEVRHWIEGFN